MANDKKMVEAITSMDEDLHSGILTLSSRQDLSHIPT